jgi:hypothetical protein
MEAEMATVERRPLPPPGSDVTSITEADRAEMIAHANDVIDHYLNGAGSYWDEGPRKPLEETVDDLRAFQAQITASKQLADDPGRILDSIDELVGGAIAQVERAIEGRDRQDDPRVPLPETGDRNSARIGISYAAPARPKPPPSRAGTPAGRTQFFSGDAFDGMQADVPEPGEASMPAAPQAASLFGLVSGKPMSFYLVQPPIWNSSNGSARNDGTDDWLSGLLRGVRSL